MKKFYQILIISVIFLAFPPYSFAKAGNEQEIKAAFIRDGNLWTIINSKETEITQSGHIHGPSWSYDGKWILYQKQATSQFEEEQSQNEIWVYNLQSGEQKKIFHDGYNPQWSPTKNVIAFQDNGVLNISDLEKFHNFALGISSFTWFPNGEKILLSSQANLEPNGWTNPVLYTKAVPDFFENENLFGNVHKLFSIPSKLQVDNKNIMSINAHSFLFSPNGNWISFIVSPTASMAMDSNMLCAITADGEKFEILDEMIYGIGKPKWAPSKEILAYIAGGGRIVFGFKDKNLKYKEFPVSSLTPNNYAELNFTWVNDHTLITSRVEAREWSNEVSEHPLPSLYTINLQNNQQTKIMEHPASLGDYDPHFLKSVNKLVWFRGKSITDQNRNIWLSDKDGSNSQSWLKNVEEIVFYEEINMK